MRITALANFDRWNTLPEADYTAAKQHWYERIVESAVRFVPDFRSHVVATDIVHAQNDSPLHRPRQRRRLRRAAKSARRHDAPEKPVHLRDRPGIRRYHRGDDQRHPDGQPAAERFRPAPNPARIRLPTSLSASEGEH